jgi:hypothetical protein
MDGALERFLCQILGIENLIPLCQRGSLVANKGTIIEFHQNGQLVTLTLIEVATRLLNLTTSSTTMRHHTFRSWCSYATAAHKDADICC